MSTLIIAEGGVNHDGDADRAVALVDAAHEAGADIIKFQTFRADDLATADAPKADYQRQRTDAHESQLAMLRRLQLDEAAHHRIIEHCRKRGITFLSSAFDLVSVRFLTSLGVGAFKIGSGEITNLPLLTCIREIGLPVYLSTGMATLGEVQDAVRALAGVPITLLHCLSAYPAPSDEANLRAMDTLRVVFQLPVGYSDHTPGILLPVAAVAMGANVIEKHLTLDRTLPGPDHAASLEPGPFREMVLAIREIEAALGDGIKRPMPSEMDTRAVARKSVVAAQDLEAGTVVRPDDLAARRPGSGISPMDLPRLAGLRLRRPVKAGALLRWTDF